MQKSNKIHLNHAGDYDDMVIICRARNQESANHQHGQRGKFAEEFHRVRVGRPMEYLLRCIIPTMMSVCGEKGDGGALELC